MDPAISKEYHFTSLLRFALPTMGMMLCMSLYSIVDGMFVSRFVGTDALSATNIVYPALNGIMALAIMLSTGGSAVVARQMGEGDLEAAKRSFTLVILAGTAAGLLACGTGILFLDPLCRFLGASEQLMGYCQEYLLILLIFTPACMLQILFQSFFVTAGRPGLGLALTLLAGFTNMALDYVFIVPLGLGVAGAAVATGAGFLVPAVCGVVFFLRRKNTLHFSRPRLDWRVLGESCFNGSSEMVTNISTGITTFFFNILMMHYLGPDGVAAITIVLYAQFLLTALYMGFSMGVAPVISYNHGSENISQLQRLYKICTRFIACSSAAVFLASLLLSGTLVEMFSPKDSTVYGLAMRGFLLFSLSFLFAGMNIFASSMFTALSNGRISAAISFLRTFVFIVLGLLFLPRFLEADGVWLAVPFAEFMTLAVSLYCFYAQREQYRYA